MTNYQICDYCGNLAERTSKNMCHSCESSYRKLRGIVEAYPNMMVLELSNQTGISVSRILAFANRGYFLINEGTLGLGD